MQNKRKIKRDMNISSSIVFNICTKQGGRNNKKIAKVKQTQQCQEMSKKLKTTSKEVVIITQETN